MRTVWKYQVSATSVETYLTIPRGAKALSAQGQNNTPTVWFELDPFAPTERRCFAVVGTGQHVPDGGRYVGTCQTFGGLLVWHIYEVTR